MRYYSSFTQVNRIDLILLAYGHFVVPLDYDIEIAGEVPLPFLILAIPEDF